MIKLILLFSFLVYSLLPKDPTIQNILEHYTNMSVQYTAIFHGFKNGNFQMKKM